jgi:NAD(P)-dependent dehydrogenase (short-subunit alcohol dehydrogenase family)
MPSSPDGRPRPADRCWFITGTSSGLGRKLVELVLSRGERANATVRRPGALADLAARYGDRLREEILDVTDARAIADVTARCLRAGPVHVVVNNAGSSIIGAAEEMTEQEIRDQLDTLLLAPILISRAFLPAMREQGGGRIVQISSVGGQTAFPASSAYHAGKWGLEGFTESVSREVAEFGIRFTLVELGSTRTNFRAGLRLTPATEPYARGAVGRFRRFIEAADDTIFQVDPAKVAQQIHHVVESDDPPLRLTLGPDAHQAVHDALQDRLAVLESQRDVAASVVFSGAGES